MSIKKNMLVIFMIVMVVMVGGCESRNNLSSKITDEIEITDVDNVVDTEATSEEFGLNQNVGQSTADVVEVIEDVSKLAGEDIANVSTEQVATEETVVEESNAEATMDTTTEFSAETTSSTEVSQPTEAEPTDSEIIESEPIKPDTPEPIIYDPYQVVNMVVAKCQAGGMITTEDNLENLLAEGKITQAEYDEYYPLDGLEGSYYSVFVETDLNIASDIVGNKLGSVDGIADYIAGMILLETHSIFNVTYAGIYTHNGVDFYEFRCHR